MNRKKLKELEGRTVRLTPPPIREDKQGASVDDKNSWHFLQLKGDTVQLLNAVSEHRITLQVSFIRQFEEPDFLILKGRLILRGSKADFEPFRPQPATDISRPDLHISLHGDNKNGVVLLSSVAPDPLRFDVANRGTEDVSNFRLTILIPQDFTRMAGALPGDFGTWKNLGEQYIINLPFTIFETFVSHPIFKGELLKMDLLPLQAPAGQYRVFWRIRCGHGTFPSDSDYGEIIVRILSHSELMSAALKELR